MAVLVLLTVLAVVLVGFIIRRNLRKYSERLAFLDKFELRKECLRMRRVYLVALMGFWFLFGILAAALFPYFSRLF